MPKATTDQIYAQRQTQKFKLPKGLGIDEIMGRMLLQEDRIRRKNNKRLDASYARQEKRQKKWLEKKVKRWEKDNEN